MQQKGFSLVELAIVLVIIGLITGGILTGQDLIRASELNSLTSDVHKYSVAVNTFKLKYNGLPGDLKNATSYWGVAAAGTACKTTTTSDIRTCDGNNDGIYGVLTTSNEIFRFWQHLANAGLIGGQYAGISASGTNDYLRQTEYNVPLNQVGGDWGVYYLHPISHAAFGYPGTFGNKLSMQSLITPAEYYSLDKKTDDGRPATGKIIGYNLSGGWNPGCTTSNNPDLAEYSISNNSFLCSYVYSMGK